MPAKWTVPKKSGHLFPPSAAFSIDIVPGSNTAIIYGGVCVEDYKRVRTSDIFITVIHKRVRGKLAYNIYLSVLLTV